VHPTQPIEIFGNVSVPFNTLVTWRQPGKILRRSSQGSPSVGGLNQRVVEKCSDFGLFIGLFILWSPCYICSISEPLEKHVGHYNALLHIVFILFPEFRMQQYKQQNSRVTYTIRYMHTWMLKDECVANLHSTNKTKMYLINTMSVHGIIWRRVGDTRINRISILSKERNRFSLVYTRSAL